MGVITEADVRLDKAQEHLDEARKIVGEVIVEEPWGWDERDGSSTYNAEHRARVRKAFSLLEQARELLKGNDV